MGSRGGPTREDTYSITVTVAGRNLGVFDKFEGGEIDSEEYKYSPGAMAPEVSLGGKRTTENVTVRRLYRLVRDHGNAQWMIDRAGKARMTIKKQPLDVDGNVFGKPIVYQGTLKRVRFPNHDSESSSPGLLELEMTPDGYPTAA